MAGFVYTLSAVALFIMQMHFTHATESVQCPAIECPDRCETGFVVDKSGCPTCRCRVACPQVMCAHDCEHGYATNQNGCPTCDCLQAPIPTCPNTSCFMQCPNGFEKDTNGCDVCRCKKACPDTMCAMYCENGFELDSDGCKMCKCKPTGATLAPMLPKHCRPVTCKMFCKHGWKKNDEGCEICACNEAPATSVTKKPCRPVMCKMYCEHGWQKNADGCDICACKKAPPTTATAKPCRPVRCRMYCEHGWQKGADGCDICACNKAPSCKPVQCYMYCKHGWERNSDGCEICRCKRPPVCPEIGCMMHCPYGYLKDKNGCNLCKCSQPTKGKVAHQAGPNCGNVACSLRCIHGFEKDTKGCDVCKCRREPLQCPMRKCIPCKYGYGKDMNGCQSCECLAPPKCQSMECGEGLGCKEIGDKVNCKPLPVCPMHKEDSSLGVPASLQGVSHVHECDRFGNYDPKQCINSTTCWCVDDRGVAVAGSLQTGDRHLIKCDYKMTFSLDVKMDLQHEVLANLVELEDDFKSAFSEEMESLLTLSNGQIPDVEVSRKNAQLIGLRFTVFDDGQTSLVAVSRYMTDRVNHQKFQINYSGATYQFVPESFSVAHSYSQLNPQPASLTEKIEMWARENLHVIISLGILAVALVVSIVLAVVCIRKRKTYERSRLGNNEPKYKKVQKV